MASFFSVSNITKLERLHRAASCAITDCFLFSPIPLLLSEVSLPPLRVTLTHLTLSSYIRALYLPTSFPISGLARLEVKPRLFNSSCRAFASTHPLMLPSTSPKEALLACPHTLLGICLSSQWSRSSPPHALTLIPLSLVKVQLFLTLNLSLLMIWCSELMALFVFVLAKAALAYLPTAFYVALKLLFPFQQVQYILVFPLKPASFYKLFAGLSSTNKSATSLFFSSCLTLVCPRHPVLSSIFPFTSNSVANLAGTVFSLFLFYKATKVPSHLFLPGNDAADDLSR